MKNSDKVNEGECLFNQTIIFLLFEDKKYINEAQYGRVLRVFWMSKY